MSKIVVFNHMTLGRIMQVPTQPEEDLRSGFQYGGWTISYAGPAQRKVVAENISATGALLFGRRTYEDFYKV